MPENMKAEYDLSKMKKREKKITPIPGAEKTTITMCLDSSVMSDVQTEAFRLGIPLQVFINSILTQYTKGDLVDSKTHNTLKDLIVRIKKEVA